MNTTMILIATSMTAIRISTDFSFSLFRESCKLEHTIG